MDATGAAVPTATWNWNDGSGFEPCTLEESLSQTNGNPDVTHAVHCMLWAPEPVPLTGLDKDKSHKLDRRALVLMHIRHDGMFGFPGGKIDDPMDGLPLEEARALIVHSLNRELTEELNYDPSPKLALTADDYLFTHKFLREVTQKPVFAHFFAHQLTREQLAELERASLASEEHGREVAGNVRVPLYTMLDGYRGLPAFLDNNFIGNARSQLTAALVARKIMSQEEVEKALKATCRKY